MTPNMTVNYMAIEATQQQVARRAARGWVVEQSVQSEDRKARPAVAGMGHWLVARGARSPWVVAAATRIALAAGTATLHEEYAG